MAAPVSKNKLVIPPEASLLPNQSILVPAKTSHYLSAADDLIARFQLQDSYQILLHPFRKDLSKSATQRKRRGSSEGLAETEEAKDALGDPPATSALPSTSTSGEAHISVNLARTYEHFLPPFLPGRLRPLKPPRKRQTINRRQALQNIASVQIQQQAAIMSNGGSSSGPEAQIRNSDRDLAKKDEEWERFKQTLRRVVYKPEYTPVEIRPLEEDAMRGFKVQAGQVDEIDRSLLEADPPPGSIQPKKKRKKATTGGPATPAAASPKNGSGPSI